MCDFHFGPCSCYFSETSIILHTLKMVLFALVLVLVFATFRDGPLMDS